MNNLCCLAVSGSLRAASLNRCMLEMAAQCAPAGLEIRLFDGLGALPLFNPDIEATDPPAVAHLRHSIASADAVLIASPEYAHGVSGVMKNALDWMVGSEAMVGKPVLLWNASPRATHALAALRETLLVMSARLIPEAGLCLLIRPDEAGHRPQNPDPAAMHTALLALCGALKYTSTL